MEQSPSWIANRFVASQVIPRVLLNPKVHYGFHKCPPPVSILSQPNPINTPTSHFLKIHPNIILPSTPGSPQWFLSLKLPHQNPTHASLLPHQRYMPRPSHSSRFYNPHNTKRIVSNIIPKFDKSDECVCFWNAVLRNSFYYPVSPL
jgi:hypothetical protein